MTGLRRVETPVHGVTFCHTRTQFVSSVNTSGESAAIRLSDRQPGAELCKIMNCGDLSNVSHGGAQCEGRLSKYQHTFSGVHSTAPVCQVSATCSGSVRKAFQVFCLLPPQSITCWPEWRCIAPIQ